MAMTGAERQRKYIDKLKSQAAHAAELAIRVMQLEAGASASAQHRDAGSAHVRRVPAARTVKRRGKAAAHAR
jgi:hypothetical protein